MRSTSSLVVANWKLNPPRAGAATELFSSVKKQLPKERTTRVVIAPPVIFLPHLSGRALPDGVSLGAQDVAFADGGAFTGQIAPGMLAECGVTHVIIGHSERRALGETDEQVARKVRAALKHKLTPIVCVGEHERDERGDFFGVVEAQLAAVLTGLAPAQLKRTVIAYEPIWAIGTGQNATPADVREMQLFIVSVLTKRFDRKTADAVTLLYGGSVKRTNALELHRDGGMRGFLVGGASLHADEFSEIVRATST